jgi:two-component system sensor histidine kinase KdpD
LINSVIQKLAIHYNQTIVFKPNENLALFKFDRGLIEQVLQNLLHNALNYTPENAIIEIVASQQSNNCVISVSDNGIGIPANEIEYLFDKFYRLPQTKTGGSGIGLSIVKGFVEAHKGIVKAENNTTGGVAFIIEFPAEASYLNNLKNE